MTVFPDVNVRIALAVAEHTHNASSRAWLDSTSDDVAFCRITQMGVLRLLTNRQVMGPDALTASRAWAVFDAFLEDSRVLLLEEPPDFSGHWRSATDKQKQGPNLWTDSYLAAFASSAQCTLVTFDTQLAARKNVSTLLLRK